MFFVKRNRGVRVGSCSSPAGRGPGHARGGYRFRLELLEDRALPSATVAPVTHFEVIAPHNAQVGQPASVEVVALDASGHRVNNSTGTVQLTSSDAGDKLPAAYTFTAKDHGEHVFQLTPETAGSDTITATDTKTAAIAGSATTTVAVPPPATHFLVVALHQATTGEQEQVQVVALDASNHVVKDYVGTVQLTSSASGSLTPVTYTFTAGDQGKHTFAIKLETAGSQTLSVKDKSHSSLTGSAVETVKAPGPATRLVVLSVSNVVPDGSSFNVLVAAVDASGHVVPNYTGTVQFASSASSATLPAGYTFTTADQGEHVFTVTLDAQGRQTVKVTDNSSKPLTGKETVFVAPTGLFGGPLGTSSLLAAMLGHGG